MKNETEAVAEEEKLKTVKFVDDGVEEEVEVENQTLYEQLLRDKVDETIDLFIEFIKQSRPSKPVQDFEDVIPPEKLAKMRPIKPLKTITTSNKKST